MHEALEVRGATDGAKAYGVARVCVLGGSSVAVLAWGASRVRLPTVPLDPAPRPPRLGLSILSISVALTVLAALGQGCSPVASWLSPALLFLGWALVDLTPPRLDRGRLARRIYRVGLIYLLATLVAAVIWDRQYRAYPAQPAYALPQRIAEDATRLYHDAYAEPIECAAGTFPLPYILSFYSPDHPHGLYGFDLAGPALTQSPWIAARALESGSRIADCGPLRFGVTDALACPAAARTLFGPPDQTRQLVYTVYDPKTRRLGQQRYAVLIWKPHRPH